MLTAARAAVACVLSAAFVCGARAQPIATVAGGGAGDGNAATAAGLFYPRAVALDASGNLYIADQSNHRVRKVAAGTGIITTLAGHGGVATFAGDGGPAVNAALDTPRGVAVDAAGNLYVADYANHRVRKVAAGSGIITTVAGGGSGTFCGDGGPATQACLQYPAGVTVDADGNLYIADEYNLRIRKVTAATGIITTVAGSSNFSGLGDGGPATSALLSYPNGVAFDASGNMFIADAGHHRIRKVTTASGIITTVAGNGESGPPADGGPAINARLQWPYGVAVDGAGNLFIADYGNQRIRKVAADTQVISTVAGSGGIGFYGDGGAATSASLNNPTHVAIDPGGNLFFADFANHRVRRVDAGSGVIDTVAGDGTTVFRGDGGPASGARLNFPSAVAFDADGNLYIAERDNNRVRRAAADTGLITSLAASLDYPLGVAVDAAGNVFISDSHNHRIQKLTPAGLLTTVAGNGELSTPAGIALDAQGNLYIADYDNHRIRRVDAATGTITTVAGSGVAGFMGDDGPATSARLANPVAVAVDAAGDLFIADSINFRVRKVAAGTGTITTVAGNGSPGFGGDGGPATSASLWPGGLAADAGGNLFVADYGSQRVRRISAATGTIATVAGNGIRNLSGDGGPGTVASLASPLGLALDARGNLFIADAENNRVRRLAGSSRAPRDHDGDGNGDVLWRNGSTGDNYIYFMSGTAIVAEGYIRSVADQNWQVAGIGDFDGDGKADILWRNSSTGQNYIYFMTATAIAAEGYIRTVSDQNWQVAGVGDFDGDGKDDILWRNAATGENYVYPMNGLAIKATEGYLRTVGDQNWQIVGVGDFDGDGKSDILWRHSTSGENYLYPMDGTTIKPSEGFVRTVANTAWQVKGVGDFNGNGRADIVWRNSSTGENYLYLMDGTSIVTEGYLRAVADPDWRIVAVGDYDGDGKSDLLWRNSSTGENYLYPMDGTTIKPSEGYIRTVADQNWQVQR